MSESGESRFTRHRRSRQKPPRNGPRNVKTEPYIKRESFLSGNLIFRLKETQPMRVVENEKKGRVYVQAWGKPHEITTREGVNLFRPATEEEKKAYGLVRD